MELDSHGSPNRSTDRASINKQNAAASKGIGSALKALTGSPGVGATSTKRSNGGGRPAKAANSKGSGASATAHVDYIDREGKYEEKGDLEFKETGNLPAWANSAREFWAAADELERANGRIYTEIEVALPREISPDQRRELVQGFIEEQLGKRHPYTVAIHNPPAALEGGEQPHAHIMFCDRTLDGIERSREQFFKRAAAPYRDRKTKEMVTPDPSKGGAAKAKEWQGRDKVFQVRESWERHYNNAVIFTDFQVSCKSLKAQGIDRQPERHLGPKMARLKSWEAGKIVEARSDRQELEEIERQITRLSREIEATPQDVVVPPQPEKTGTSPAAKTKTVKKQEIDQTPDLTRCADPEAEDLRPRDTISSGDTSKNAVGDITSPVVIEGNGQSEALPPVKETSLPIQQPAFDVQPVQLTMTGTEIETVLSDELYRIRKLEEAAKTELQTIPEKRENVVTSLIYRHVPEWQKHDEKTDKLDKADEQCQQREDAWLQAQKYHGWKYLPPLPDDAGKMEQFKRKTAYTLMSEKQLEWQNEGTAVKEWRSRIDPAKARLEQERQGLQAKTNKLSLQINSEADQIMSKRAEFSKQRWQAYEGQEQIRKVYQNFPKGDTPYQVIGRDASSIIKDVNLLEQIKQRKEIDNTIDRGRSR
jgi:hypothetical protein